MTLKRRLKTIEKDMAPKERPKVLFFTTYYERREGGADFYSARAIVTGSEFFVKNSVPLRTKDGETFEQFKSRVCDTVEEKTGVRPINERDILKYEEGRTDY